MPQPGLTRVLCGLLLVFPLAAWAADSPVKFPQPNGAECVEPADDMRRNHMEYLLHQRDETVIKGIRTTKHSLVECIDCHASKNEQGEFLPINDPDQFCGACHVYAAVSIDCFECHANKPDPIHSAAGSVSESFGRLSIHDVEEAR